MKTRAFLIFCAVGLVPIALGYGAKPSVTLDALFGITVDTTNLTHIMRAVMGLYLGMVVFWLMGAFQRSMEGAALAGMGRVDEAREKFEGILEVGGLALAGHAAPARRPFHPPGDELLGALPVDRLLQGRDAGEFARVQALLVGAGDDDRLQLEP